MRFVRFSLALVAALNVGLQAPLVAWAAPPSGGVQPVPYNPSQPVPVAPLGAPPAPAPAAPPSAASTSTGGDTIFLKGGGMIRGRLVEVIPNDHATIALSTGQTAIVEWGRIERIEQQQAPQPVPVVVPAPTVIRGPAGSAWVHVESDKDVVLEARPPDGGWAVVCNAPCDQTLPLDSDYRISGSGVRTSRVFRLAAQPGQKVVISVNPGSKGGFVGGIVLASIGLPVTLVGLLILLVGAAEASVPGNSQSEQDSAKSTETAGGIVALVGVGAVVVGVVLVATNARTSETQEVVHGVLPPKRDESWLRVPTWHEASGAHAGIPSTVSVPLFTHTF